MTKPFKLVIRLVFCAVLVVLATVLLRNVVAQALLQRHLRSVTGMDVAIGRVHIGLTEPVLALENLRLFNTDEFGRATCVDIPELHIEYDLQALRAKQLHLRTVRLRLAELLVVQNNEGKNNFKELVARPEMKASLPGGRTYQFKGIDTLNLALGRFRYSNLQNPGEDDEIFIGLKNQIVRNVRSLEDVKPLLNRLALERNGKQFYDKCFNRSSKPNIIVAPPSVQVPGPHSPPAAPAEPRNP